MKACAATEELSCLDFFGLHHNPFPVSPDEENFYSSEYIEQVLAEIIFGIHTRKGFMVMTGEVGHGKTTISRRLMNILEAKGVETSLVFHTAFQDVELIREINRDFGLKTKSLLFSDQMRLLNNFLLAQNLKGKNCAIIIDDAQNLNFKSLELVRMISNLETDQQKLVQILLVGQPELMDKLNTHKLRQLRSRVVIHKEVRALTRAELENYLFFKLNLAGNRGLTTIRKTALNKTYKLSKGNFRQVNLLMDRCLYVAFLRDTTEITGKVVAEAYGDLYPNTAASSKKPLVLLASVLMALSLYLLGGVVNFDFHQEISSAGPTVKTYPMPKANKPALTPATPAGSGQATDSHGFLKKDSMGESNLEISEQDTGILGAVTDFLDSYQLSEYEETFLEALKTYQFQGVTAAIFAQTGQMLIQLNHVPDHVRAKYGILNYPAVYDGAENFFLFWRPKFLLNDFYYFYQGKEIRMLQAALAKIHLYNDPLDEIVGTKLVKAIVDFQQQTGLPVTGYPDERTLFLLCHAPDNNKNDA